MPRHTPILILGAGLTLAYLLRQQNKSANIRPLLAVQAYSLKNSTLKRAPLIHKIKITILILASTITIMEVIEKQDIIQKLSDSKELLFSKYGIKELAIFGSVSRGDNTASSDLDVLVDFNRKIGIEFIDLADELEDLLNVKVDLVSKNGIKKKYFKIIEKDLEYV